MQLTRNHITFGLMAVLAVMAVFAIAGHPLVPPEALAGLGMIPLAVGEVDVPELKKALEKQAEAWGEFTRKNDELLKAKAEGKAVADLQATVDKINADLKKTGDDLIELAKKANRPTTDDPKAITPEMRDYKQAYAKYLRKGETAGLEELQVKALNAGTGPEGGYIVLPEMDGEIARVVSVVSAIGRLARNVTTSSEVYKKVVKKSGMTARRTAPGATGGETTAPTYAELEYTAYEAEAEPWVFNSTLQDAVVDLEMDLANEAAISFAELAGSEFAVGTGVGGAKGITAYDTVANASYAWGSLGYVVSGGASDFASSDPGDAIISLQHALKSQYRPGAAFVMADATLAKVRQMKDGSGNFYLWQPDPLAGFGGRLLGSPVEIDDNMPTVAANALAIAYGNFQQGYMVTNRTGTVLIRDAVTAKGKTKFNFRRRWGGGVQNFEAIKLLKISA